jgi:hypothetical protein
MPFPTFDLFMTIIAAETALITDFYTLDIIGNSQKENKVAK